VTVDCLLHVHSSFSYDSKTDLTDIARIARCHGIRCVLVTEHNNQMSVSLMEPFVARCAALSDEQLLIIPGLELAFDSNRVHLLAYGVREYIHSTAPGCTFESLVEAIRKAGGVAVLAHPSHRQAVSRIDPRALRSLDGIEIWNVKNGNRFFPTVSDVTLLRSVRADAAHVFGFAGLDWHHLNKFSRLVHRLDVPALTAHDVLRSLRAGAFEVRGGWVTLPATGETRRGRALLYKLGSQVLPAARHLAYRWQFKLERNGFRTPDIVKAVARRLF